MLELKGKKIAILGFGKEGQATFEYLQGHGIPVSAVLDGKDSLTPDQQDVIKKTAAEFIGGSKYLDTLNDYEVIFRSPGMPRMHPKLLAFKDQEAILSNTKLFFELCPCPIIAVTGTKGKTTTVSIIYEVAKAAGKKVFLGGNIGEPPLAFLKDLSPDALAILEVSSFQAQDLHKSPHVGVILNVTHDHLDDGTFRAASHASNQEYLLAKAQLIAHQTDKDVAILHSELGDIFKNSGRGRKIIMNPEEFKNWSRRIPGEHNLENISAAVLTCRELGISEEVIKSVIEKFAGVQFRLQTVAEKHGVTFINDSASTNPDSTIAAIHSFTRPLVLILGGAEKGLDYSELGKLIRNSSHVKALVVIGQIAPKILAAVEGFTGKIITGALNMTQIISQVNSVTEPGDIVLLSPAAASFGMFENSKDRGHQFNRAIESL